MSKSSLFVASSREALDVAWALQENLDQDADVTVWDQDVFRLSGTAVDDLLKRLLETDFAVFVYSPEDRARIRGDDHRVVRDNIVFEHGLFLGVLGRQRAFMLTPEGVDDLHIPSDLAGINPARFNANRDDKNLRAALGPPCNQIRKEIRRLGRIIRVPQLIVPQKSREVVLTGVTKTRDAIARAYGPRGGRVEVQDASRSARATRDGTLIAVGVRGASPLEERGCEEMRSIAVAMEHARGDGTKLAMLLAHRIATAGAQSLDQGHHPHDLVAGIEKAISTAARVVGEYSETARDRTAIESVARTASSGDVAILVTDAMEAVGRDGIINVEEGLATSTELFIAEGTSFDRGFLSSSFVTDAAANACVLEECWVLIAGCPLTQVGDVLPAMELAAQQRRPLFIIADRVESEVLATLVANCEANILRSCAVLAPGHGEYRRELLEDLACLTGARILGDTIGRPVQSVVAADLGTASSINTQKERTTIREGGAAKARLEQRIASLKGRAEVETTAFELERLQQRVANLQGCIATIRVGGLTNAEITGSTHQIRKALNSASAALRGGIVPGGGAALLGAARVIAQSKYLNGGEDAGREAVVRSLREPTTVLIQSSKTDVLTILPAIDGAPGPLWGWDVATATVRDLKVAGVLDATEVVVHALHLASSHARALLLTEMWEVIVAPPDE